MTKTKPQPTRVSFSLLSRWAAGDVKGAIVLMLHLRSYTSRAMAVGDEMDKRWKKHITETGTLPAEFGGGKLTKPWCNNTKVQAFLTPSILLVGAADCIDAPCVHEFKTGGGDTKAEDYANKHQVGTYGILYTLANKLYIDRAFIHHYNTVTNEATGAFVWLTDSMMRETHKWLIDNARGFQKYCAENREIIRSLQQGYGH